MLPIIPSTAPTRTATFKSPHSYNRTVKLLCFKDNNHKDKLFS